MRILETRVRTGFGSLTHKPASHQPRDIVSVGEMVLRSAFDANVDDSGETPGRTATR